MNQEIQVNIYWHNLLEKWVGEVNEVGKDQTCLYYTEKPDWDEVALGVSRFIMGLTAAKVSEYA